MARQLTTLSKIEKTMLIIIAGLLDLLKEHYKTEEEIIAAFNSKTPKVYGGSPRNLEKYFASAKKERKNRQEAEDAQEPLQKPSD